MDGLRVRRIQLLSYIEMACHGPWYLLIQNVRSYEALLCYPGHYANPIGQLSTHINMF